MTTPDCAKVNRLVEDTEAIIAESRSIAETGRAVVTQARVHISRSQETLAFIRAVILPPMRAAIERQGHI